MPVLLSFEAVHALQIERRALESANRATSIRECKDAKVGRVKKRCTPSRGFVGFGLPLKDSEPLVCRAEVLLAIPVHSSSVNKRKNTFINDEDCVPKHRDSE